MTWMRSMMSVASTALVCAMMFCTVSAASPNQSGISALKGVDAQPMTAAEMQAVSGELNAYDIAAALTTLAAKEAKYPKLQADTLKLAAYFSTNAVTINASFAKLGILTACKSCTK